MNRLVQLKRMTQGRRWSNCSGVVVVLSIMTGPEREAVMPNIVFGNTKVGTSFLVSNQAIRKAVEVQYSSILICSRSFPRAICIVSIILLASVGVLGLVIMAGLVGSLMIKLC